MPRLCARRRDSISEYTSISPAVIPSPATYRLVCLGQALLLAFSAIVHAGEIELKSLNTLKDGSETKKKYGPYVGFYGGKMGDLGGKVSINGLGYGLNKFDDGSIYGIEVGKSWKSKKYPFMLSLEFEASFANSELSGSVDAASQKKTDPLTGLPLYGDNALHSYKTDMNAVYFMVNSQISLDLYRYRARLGKFIGGLRPYVGGGLGGGQLWFRNTVTQSKAQAADPLSPIASTANPFAVDDFVNVWHWYGGLEYTWKDKYSIYAEYRDLHYGDLPDVLDLSTSGWVLGYRYRY